MTAINEQGQKVYYNMVEKRGTIWYIIKAASGQVITGRDRQKRFSRSFAQYHQAEAWLERNGYKVIG